MAVKTPFDYLKDHYVITRTDHGLHTGKLDSINSDIAVLNPSIDSRETSLGTLLYVSETPSIIAYPTIKSFRDLGTSGNGYIQRLVNDSKIAVRFNVLMRLKELEARSIKDETIQKSLEELLKLTE